MVLIAIVFVSIFIYLLLGFSPTNTICSCLVERFPNKHDSWEDFEITLKYAYLYAKTVTLGMLCYVLTSSRLLIRNKERHIGQKLMKFC